jgi:hypothetical protein
MTAGVGVGAASCKLTVDMVLGARLFFIYLEIYRKLKVYGRNTVAELRVVSTAHKWNIMCTVLSQQCVACCCAAPETAWLLLLLLVLLLLLLQVLTSRTPSPVTSLPCLAWMCTAVYSTTKKRCTGEVLLLLLLLLLLAGLAELAFSVLACCLCGALVRLVSH